MDSLPRHLVDSVNVDYIPKAIVSAEYGLRMIHTSENGKYTATMEISPEEFKELYESILRE